MAATVSERMAAAASEAVPADGKARLAQAVEQLASTAGFTGPVRLEALPGGGNNRGYRVNAGGQALFLKAYFHHPADPRDRLGAEFSFSTFAWQAGIRRLPRPLAADHEARLGLYELIDGRRLAAGEISAERVQEAASFFAELNAARGEAGALGMASEACFSLAEHLACIRARVQRLAAASAADAELGRFVDRELAPYADEVFEAIERLPASRLNGRLPRQAWCVSPSDFGFHNALLQPDGQLRFVDFEYAGWDEPARMISDFFCQVDAPVSEAHLGPFSRTALAAFEEPALHLDRMQVLLPLYRLKWCCIVLNEFLPAGAARRRFAGLDDGQEVRRQQQLAKARAMLDRLAAAAAA